MPLYKTITVNATTEILVWKITESITQLRAEVPLKEKSARRLNGMKSELHQRGFLSVRKLLQEKGYTDIDLHYDQFGKPYFEDGKHISISHSHSFSTIIISDQIAGIDLEMRRDKIAVIADKFINPKEFADLNKQAADYINKLTVLWGIKEVIFKIRSEAGISFKDHIKAEPFDMQQLKTTAWLDIEHLHQSFAVYFEEIENFTLVYAFENL
ncbi:MAG: 4'-phosphopantetheinyl transferase superfamily protein [Burkholderiales bacterium]|nr:4'-phosphopantetheinyl transferase superfamily protein [Flavobacterium sp.]